jgi:hypothetical protein
VCEGIAEKDNIIANDIETDKLLNAIEKSKGFSDTLSTTAARRLRNRMYPLNSLSYENNNNKQINEKYQNSNVVKKVTKLKWNEDKQELEYSDREKLENNLNSNEDSATIKKNNGETIKNDIHSDKNYNKLTNNISSNGKNKLFI